MQSKIDKSKYEEIKKETQQNQRSPMFLLIEATGLEPYKTSESLVERGFAHRCFKGNQKGNQK